MDTECAELSGLELVQALNRLARDCGDASRGLHAAVRSLDDPDLAVAIAADAQRLAAFRTQLHALVLLEGGAPRRAHQASKVLKHALGALQASLHGTDSAALDRCLDLERAAERRLSVALKRPIPDEPRALLRFQRREVQRMREHLERERRARTSERGS